MANIKLKNKLGTETNYNGVDILRVPAQTGAAIDFVDASSADAAASDILASKTAFVGTTKVTGTIPTKTDADITSSGGVVTIPSGYYAQQYTKQGDPSGDATMTSGDQMLNGITAYSQGTKYTGTIVTKTSEDLTAENDTVSVPAGYYATTASKTIAAGEQGTPIATKGTVSDHSIAVTPSATDTTGYITGTTKTGAAVTVSASELVSGNYALNSSIEAQTDVDVTNYATVSVAAMPTTTLDNSIISGEAYEEAAGDYAWKSTVTIPAGYHNAGTIEKTFSEVFPAPATPGTAADVRLGKQFYDKSGKVVTGTMTEKSEATYIASTEDQTIAGTQFLTGAQTIKAVALSATAANILNNDVVSITSNGATVTSVTGTMTNNGAVTSTISSQGGTYTIPAGYHNGSGVITATLPTYDGTVETT